MDAIALYDSDSSNDEDRDENIASVTIKTTSIPILTEDEAREQEIFARHVPHVVGHWAGHIYLELNDDTLRDDDEDSDDDNKDDGSTVVRRRWIQILRDQMEAQNLPVRALVLHDQWHVSLSKTFYLQNYNIESFIKSLQDAISSSTFQSPLTISVHGNQPVILTNKLDLSTTTTECRTFWCSRVHPPLQDLIRVVDKVLSNWQLPPFYDPPVFHTSWASAPGDWSGCDEIAMTESLVFTVNHVTCRIGDKVFHIPFAK